MPANPHLALMAAANTHAKAHGAQTPVLAPLDATLLGENPPVNVAQLHKAGFRVIPWTTNDPAKMRTLITLHVDGIISDRPDILQSVLKEEAAISPAEAALDVAGHRGARGLRPENTLPAFEAGLDNLVTSLETDIGITTDHVPLICHDQFLNPHSCRRADGVSYTFENRVYIRDISLAEAQSTFICDKLHSTDFPDQTNNLALSSVAVAFAAHQHLINPYVPTHVEQLFRFTRFYADFYRTGPGKSHPDATPRAANAEKVRFNIETKILPLPNDPEGRSAANHTADPQTFVTALKEVIQQNKMEDRTRILSFDFRILQLIEEQYPKIPTWYLTESASTLSTALIPPSLRQP